MVLDLLFELGAALFENVGELLGGAAELVAENAGAIALGAGMTAVTLAGTYIVVDLGMRYKTNKGLHEYLLDKYFSFSDRVQNWLRKNSVPKDVKVVVLRIIEVGDNTASRIKRGTKKMQAVAVDANNSETVITEETCSPDDLPADIKAQVNAGKNIMLYEAAA